MARRLKSYQTSLGFFDLADLGEISNVKPAEMRGPHGTFETTQ
jgi:hypothetical protein